MTWPAARAQLVTMFGTLAITSPTTETISRVYATPPGQLQDLPCVVIDLPAYEVERRIGGFREDIYTVDCIILVRDERVDDAGALVSAYAEATIALFDANVTLNGAVTLVRRQDIQKGTDITYGDIVYIGTRLTLELETKQTATFSA